MRSLRKAFVLALVVLGLVFTGVLLVCAMGSHGQLFSDHARGAEVLHGWLLTAKIVEVLVGGLAFMGAVLFKGLDPDLEMASSDTTHPLVIVLALVLFGPLALIAIGMFLDDFDGGASTLRWAGTTLFLVISNGLTGALLAVLVRRIRRPVTSGRVH